MKGVVALTEEQREIFTRFLYLCEKYKSSWFFDNNGNANKRNYIEDRDFISYETVVNGIYYYLHFSVQLSCKHVYKSVIVLRDSEKTTARVIRTLLEKDISHAA